MDNHKKSAITLNSPQKTAEMKYESSNIVRRAQYIAATKEIHNKVYDLLLTLLEDLREMVKSMLEKSYPDIDWLEQYQAAFVSNSSEKLQKKTKKFTTECEGNPNRGRRFDRMYRLALYGAGALEIQK